MPTATKPVQNDWQAVTRSLRADIIRMLEKARSGHPGGSLSIIDILAVLYGEHLKHRPAEPNWPERDLVVLSKGHGCPALYAVMAHHGYFPKDSLSSLRKLGSPLQGHPDRLRLPGIEVSTGSLGQGLSIAQGMAMAAKMDGKNRHVWCILGDGEMQEGQIWEALMSAPKFGLGNLTAILDFNNSQIDGSMEEVMDINPLADKIRAFRWNLIEIDGHDFGQIGAALAQAKKSAVPSFIAARTVKGKGVSFMEHRIEWHGKAPDAAQTAAALKEIADA